MPTIVHYWAGCPKSTNSKWQRFLANVQCCTEHGWRNYLVWSKMPDNPELFEPFKKAGCEIILLPRSCRNFDPASIWRIYKLLRNLKCDVFHCHNDHTSPLIGAVLARVHVRIWSKLAMSSHYENNEKPKGLHRLMPSTRVSYFCAHQILAISNKVGSELIETVGSNRKIKTVPVPVDFSRFANAHKGNIRREMDFEQSNIVIISIGHSVPVKGWDVAIKAFIEVHKKLPNVRMLLVGDQTSPEFFNQLTGLIKQYDMEDNIKFAGNRNDIPEILKSSDIFILPSRSEGMPGSLVEAMAAGLPCIAAEVGGVPEVIIHGNNGLLFKRANSQELAESLINLIKNKKLQTKLASQASKHARQFNMEAYVEKVFNYYNSLLNKDNTT